MSALAELLPLSGQLVIASLLAIGGALAIVPYLHHVMVADTALLTETQFNASIAIAQASPGPNVLFVAVMGYQAAGTLGAIVMLSGILLPSTTLAFAAARWGHTRREWRSIRAFKAGTVPVVIALLFASGWTLGAAAANWRAMLVTALCALLAWRTRVPLLVLIAVGAFVGALGWV